ncbi:MAG: hypothetical protein LKK16_08835 [Bacteroidales bacterium]|nr:hypothetical protein [Bacteroidales bacterium]MCI2136402.1 hypothetical protein [Bacteroidales bacterium]
MPQSGLGVESAVLHQGRGMERSAQRQCRKGIRADHPGDVVQGIYRRMASEQDRLYYISGGKRGKAPRNTADWGTAAGLYRM